MKKVIGSLISLQVLSVIINTGLGNSSSITDGIIILSLSCLYAGLEYMNTKTITNVELTYKKEIDSLVDKVTALEADYNERRYRDVASNAFKFHGS